MLKPCRHFFFIIFMACLELPSANPSPAPTGISTLCTELTIPFPFGIPGLSPYLPGFSLVCNAAVGDFPRLFLVIPSASTMLRLLQISLKEGFVRVEVGPFSWNCDGDFAEGEGRLHDLPVSLEGSPYTFSETQNKLTVIGCDAMVLLRRHGTTNSMSGCVSFCMGRESVVDGLCSGVGCCQAAIPRNLQSFELEFRSIRNLTGSHEYKSMPCSRAFILEQKAFAFSGAGDLNGSMSGGDAPRSVVLNWSVGNKSCHAAKLSGDYICAEKAECSNSSTGAGYLCRCMVGYDGNPYLKGGCRDIDECRDSAANPCKRKCVNLEGSYRCTCPFGTSGDGKKKGSGCKAVAPIEMALAIGLCILLALFIGSFVFYTKRKNRRVELLKQTHFTKNGGLFLQKHWSGRESAANIFTAGELEKATDKFSESRVLGRGGYGTVYRGTLVDGREVAVKKSMVVDETQIDQFVNEMFILSQINHRNVVKLLGCCLETPVPLLVHEFISNGTLFERLHSGSSSSSLTWEIRLRIAEETAVALAHLHEAASKPIIHRDVKSANILLDEQFTAKVSDFGASRLVPYNQTHVTTVVQGTLGYLDPEYFHKGLLTEKSDVYSFGVVLVELLTGKKPVTFVRSDEVRNLASYFVRLVRENRLIELLDRRLAVDAGRKGLASAAELATKCLNVRGEDRPTMKEVAVELNALRKLL